MFFTLSIIVYLSERDLKEFTDKIMIMYRYPLEIVSDIYLSKVGGYSYELDEKEVGINAKALEMNTSLIPNETFVTIRLFRGKIKPYFFKRRFLIVGVEENMDCYELTKNGEVVLSESLGETVEVGEEVIINAVEFFRVDGDYSNLLKAILCRLESLKKEN
ncbi:MAG: hypothetical protein QXM06_00625 [Archaeoglobaceae archaeon]